MSAQRRLVHYSGRVQGVGFRFTTKRIADGHEVSGYVCNLPDGRVELVAEGSAHELDHFLGEIRDRLEGHIRDEQCDQAPANGQFQGFQIQY